MVSVSLVLIRTAVAPSFTKSFVAIISNHVISIFGGVTELVSEPKVLKLFKVLQLCILGV